MDLTKIKDVLNEYADEKELKLFDVAYHRNDSTLCVTFDEDLSLERLEEVSREISDILDRYEDEFEDNYFLDVSTVGAERPIRNMEELSKAVGSYVFMKDDKNEYYGDLMNVQDGMIRLQVKDKNRTKTVELSADDIKEMRYAVKF